MNNFTQNQRIFQNCLPWSRLKPNTRFAFHHQPPNKLFTNFQTGWKAKSGLQTYFKSIKRNMKKKTIPPPPNQPLQSSAKISIQGSVKPNINLAAHNFYIRLSLKEYTLKEIISRTPSLIQRLSERTAFSRFLLNSAINCMEANSISELTVEHLGVSRHLVF